MELLEPLKHSWDEYGRQIGIQSFQGTHFQSCGSGTEEMLCIEPGGEQIYVQCPQSLTHPFECIWMEHPFHCLRC